MPAVSRLGHKANCPADSHGCLSCAHNVTGPSVGGSGDVYVNGQPVLRVTDPGVHSSCCGANKWKVKLGSGTVIVNGKPTGRKSDATQHCGGIGKLIEGSGDVYAGGPPSASA